MAAVALDPMEFMQQLEASGMPRPQAEAVVRGYTAMLVHNFDALVTKDYLDTRFSEFESRIDLRFADLESRIDRRFAEADGKLNDLESRMDLRFAEAANRTDAKINDLSSRMDLRFAELESKMDVRFARMNVILGILLVGIIIPNLQAVLTWVR